MKHSRIILSLVIVIIAGAIVILSDSEEASVNEPKFAMRAQELGLDYVHAQVDGYGRMPCEDCGEMEILLRHHAAGVAFDDYDADGWVDVFVTRVEQPPLLFKNIGGQFEDVTEEAGLNVETSTSGAVWVDIDNDADVDLVVSVIEAGHTLVFVNQGDGTFVEEGIVRGFEQREMQSGYGIALGDVNADGWTDLFVSQWGAPLGTSELMVNQGADNPGVFVSASEQIDWEPLFTTEYFFASAFVDVDQDNDQDLFVVGDFGTSRLFENDGTGFFVDVTAQSGLGTDENGMGLAVADVNADGLADFYVTSIYEEDLNSKNPEQNWVCAQRDLPAYQASERAATLRSMTESPDVDPAELNPEIFYSAPCDSGSSMPTGWTGNRLFVNQGDGSFLDEAEQYGFVDGGWGWGAVFFDADHDGEQELFAENGFERVSRSEAARFWFAGKDTSQSLGIEQVAGRGVATADIDNDGDLDLFDAVNIDAPRLYTNNMAAGSWLQVQVDQPVGAVVRVETSETQQTRYLGLGNLFLGQSQSIAHFGLAEAQGPLRVTISWPHLEKEIILEDVEPNQVLSAQLPQ